MLFITVRSASPADVPKVLQVVEHVKRLRHKRGATLLSLPLPPRTVPLIRIADVTTGALSEDLHQYVVYDSQPAGLQRIKLDDPPRNAYTPPSSLSVHLSKISMPELHPRSTLPKLHTSPQPLPPPPPRSVPTPSARQPLPQARVASAPPDQLRRPRSSFFHQDAPLPPIPPQQQQQQQQQHQATGFGSLWGRPRK
jgi:hypothetical protein